VTISGRKTQIEESLKAFIHQPLEQAAVKFLDTLGYRSDRRFQLRPNTAASFINTFCDGRTLNQAQAMVDHWQSVNFLFQLTGDEIRSLAQGQFVFQDKGRYDGAAIESYLFFAIHLSQDLYSRTQLSAITRAVNRLFDMPAMLLFRHGETITISVIRRRLNKRDESRDVLEKVTLIKDIRCANPHRAHVDILYDLSIETLSQAHRFANFVELHNAWQRTLDTKTLSKRFYEELSNWYFWSLQHVAFPDDVEKDAGIRNATNLIRLITRIIFVWFIKEKGLIPEVIFNKRDIQMILKDFYKNEESSDYYRAILQNLFFGTLNQKVNERDFAKGGGFPRSKSEYGVKNLFRYADSFAISQQEALGLFKNVPFLNGGLFDCLDRPDDAGKILYVDGFSRNDKKQAVVPDFLFFADQQEIDLNETYGTKNKKYETRGLVEILSGYKFTVAENTPIEEEVALDPELLGKVFENLLASYNPETQITARKQTGSFYTPREIVDYMVEESLKAYLKGVLTSLMSDEDAQIALDVLFAYTEKEHLFNEDETKALINGIDTCKILDPACGSGAFPMGVLHRMVYILHKLDPNNERWKRRQIDKVDKLIEEAGAIPDAEVREQVVSGLEYNRQDIEDAFGANELDYGRKLYLIENCIYGVDIQPIAVQIAKLRFFISLVIDQKRQAGRENLGIRALPNLETKFVAANTLIGLSRPKQGSLLRDKRIDELEKELQSLRHKYFSARTRTDKIRYQSQDRHIREKIAERLKVNGWDAESARRIVRFDPYDLNGSADFFEPEWMFGITDGFDVVIGNPPYVRADSGEDHLAMRRQIIETGQYETLWEKWDLFIPFIERSYKLLDPGGITSLIVSDAYCHSKYAQKSQEWFLRNSRILRLDFFSKIKIFDAAVHNVTYFFQKADGTEWKPERRVHEPEFGSIALLSSESQNKLTYRAFFPEDVHDAAFSSPMRFLEETCYVSYGLRPSSDENEAKGEFVTADLVQATHDKVHCKPYVEGKHLSNWVPETNLWLEWGTDRAPGKFCRPTFPQMYSVPEKIIAQRSPGPDPVACYDDSLLVFSPASVGFVPWHSLAGVRNKSLKKAARYRGEKPPRPDLPKREELEKVSKRFSVKYLLAIMNSTVARDFLRANRRSNIHLYPDDWKKLPIPDASIEDQAPIIELVDEILEAKRADKTADISVLETRVDKLVSHLYGVTTDAADVREATAT
jgi:ribosomal protein L29